MIELRPSGNTSRSHVFPLAALPLVAGRNSSAAIPLSGPGIWDSHFRIELDPLEGLVAESIGDAFTVVDGETLRRRRLRNGDIIECGEARLQFWLAPAPQRTLRGMELAVWMIIGLVALAEVAVANWIGR